jgi:TetR/AcrR family transcriptional regulator, cholesterol catabolism regulator
MTGHSGQVGRRERHKQATWNRLYESSVELFTLQGYDETTVDDIAERADVARGTFFNYFERKDDVITAWADRRRELLQLELVDAAAKGTDFASCLEHCLRKLSEINLADWKTSEVMLAAWVRAGNPISEAPHTAKVFADIIDIGRKQGQVASEVNVMRAGNILRDVYLGTLFRYVGSGERPTGLQKDLLASLRLILGGLKAR